MVNRQERGRFGRRRGRQPGEFERQLEFLADGGFRTARHWHFEDVPPVSGDIDPYRLPGINVSTAMTMDRFRALSGVEG